MQTLHSSESAEGLRAGWERFSAARYQGSGGWTLESSFVWTGGEVDEECAQAMRDLGAAVRTEFARLEPSHECLQHWYDVCATGYGVRLRTSAANGSGPAHELFRVFVNAYTTKLEKPN